MNLILLTKSRGMPVTRQLNSLVHFVVLGVFLLAAGGGVAYLGYYWGANQDPSVLAQKWERELRAQREELSLVKQSARADVDALTMRLGQLQSYVSRLDALGIRLVKMAELDPSEFNFGEPPALGGPENVSELLSVPVPELHLAISDVDEQLQQRDRELAVLEQLILNRNLRAEVHPAGRPIKRGWRSSAWGMRKDPFTGRPAFHRGVDFAGKKGQDVVAVAGGVVVFAGKRWGYGHLVEINHGSGYSTRYAHNLENLVEVGDPIKKGDVVARMGTTGRSTGYHVHFEVLKDGRQINPSKFIASKQ